MDSTSGGEFLAEFTGTNPNPPCQRCKARYPAAELKFIRGSNPNEGLALCLGCQMHYREKSKSAMVPSSSGRLASNNTMISKQVAAAQRGDTRLKVKAVGQPVFKSLRDIGRGMGAAYPNTTHPNHPSRVMGPPIVPRVVTPEGIHIHSGSMLPFRRINASSFGTLGYTQAHSMYEAMREHFVKLAYKGGGAGTIEISARLATWHPKRRHGMEFLSEPHIIPNVSPDIGVDDVRSAVLVALWPAYLKWSANYPIAFDEVSLRAPSWEELRANPSRHVCLGIPHDKYVAILNHLDNIEEKIALAEKGATDTKTSSSSLSLSLFAPTISPPSPSPPPFYPSFSQSDISLGSVSRPIHIPDDDGDNNDEIIYGKEAKLSQPPPVKQQHKHKHERPETPLAPPRKVARLSENTKNASITTSASPDADSIRMALQAQDKSTKSKKNIRSMFNTVKVACKIYLAPRLTFAKLIEDPSLSILQQSVAPFETDLFFDPKGESHSGSFKVARFGHTTPPVFTGTSSFAAQICIKQAFEAADSSHTKRRLYLGEKQARALEKEIICHIWATSLLDLVYSFMEEFDAHHHMAPPFRLPPRMRFVYAALAVSGGISDDDPHKLGKSYLIEEVIDEAKEGPFMKYINNDKAKPLILADPEASLRADFLAFTQHVQYYKSKKMLFVSDYQGGKTLLTDAQIISAPDVTCNPIFASGNLSSAFLNFGKDHECNRFCQWYDLKRDFNRDL